jgi:hypothetical protein
MKGKYLDLVLTTSFHTDSRDPAGLAPMLWLKELCQYQEFRDVHASQGKYYPAFALLLDRELQSACSHCKWAVD